MMKLRNVVVFLPLAGVIACGRPSRENVARPSLGGDGRIVNGTRAPQETYLDEGQMLAIGYLVDGEGKVFCTATMTHPWVAVTAAHCFGDDTTVSPLYFGIGESFGAPRERIPVGHILTHPSADFAAVVLATPVSKPVADLVPIDLNRELPQQAWIGHRVDAAGFGDTRSGEQGRFFASVQIENIDDESITVDGQGQQGLCFGDSGGPIIWQPEAHVSPVIVGVEGRGDVSCVGRDHVTRVDRVFAWLQQELETFAIALDERLGVATGHPQGACGSVDGAGLCDGDVAIWCDAGSLRQQDCATSETRCGWLGADMGYYCMPATCTHADTDYAGACDGSTLTWCSWKRGLRTQFCGDDGMECRFIDEKTGYSCFDPHPQATEGDPPDASEPTPAGEDGVAVATQVEPAPTTSSDPEDTAEHSANDAATGEADVRAPPVGNAGDSADAQVFGAAEVSAGTTEANAGLASGEASPAAGGCAAIPFAHHSPWSLAVVWLLAAVGMVRRGVAVLRRDSSRRAEESDLSKFLIE